MRLFFFFWIQGFKKAIDQLETEAINKNLLEGRISGEQLEELTLV